MVHSEDTFKTIKTKRLYQKVEPQHIKLNSVLCLLSAMAPTAPEEDPPQTKEAEASDKHRETRATG